MTSQERLQARRRAVAAKLTHPKVTELPSGAFRAQLQVKGERLSEVGEDPEVVHATILARANGVIAKKRVEKQLSLTVAEAVDEYIAARSTVCSPATLRGYQTARRHHLQSLMTLTVEEIQPRHVQAAVNEDAERLSAKTIKNALTMTSAAVEQYKPLDISRIILPQRKKKEHAYLQEEGLIDLFDAIRGEDVECFILLAVWLGMRRSEIAGLCWDCVDFDKRQIIVKRTYLLGPDGKWNLEDRTKTEGSARSIDCPGYILARLEELRPVDYKPQARVFRCHPNTPYAVLKRLCKEHGIEFVGIHGLRHTNASVLLSLGVVDRVTMARGGWSTDYTLKQIYQHLFQSDLEAAGEKLDNFMLALVAGRNPREKSPEVQG